MPVDPRPSPAPLLDRTQDGRALVPTSFRTAGEGRRGPGRPSGRRASALPWTASRPLARWRLIGGFALALSWIGAPACARAADEAPFGPAERDRVIAAAAARFDLPSSWISAVMRVESGYDAGAISSAGAIGLMQVMPRTYAELRVRHGLGADPFHPRDNVMAGAAYLRELYDRFGAPGFLAAYNAGPERYARRLADGRPLPLETRRYLAALAPVILASGEATAAAPAPAPSVFVQLRGDLGSSASAPSALFVLPRPSP